MTMPSTKSSTMAPNKSPASCRRRLYDKGVPKEVHIQENPQSPIKRGREEDGRNNDENSGSPKKTCSSRGHIQPGHAEQIPEPPESDPPTLTELVPLAFIGPAKAGKTSVLRSFVQRQYVTNPPTHVEDVPLPVDYFKKDFSFHDVNNKVCCVRLQCYDVNRGGPHTKFLKNQKKEWLRLMSKVQQIVLVVSLDESNLLNAVTEWKEWLDKILQNQEQQPITSLLLTQSDTVEGLGPIDWMRLGASILEACRFLKISRWYVSSACLDHSYESVDVVMRSLAEDTLFHRRSQREKCDPTVSPGTRNSLGAVPATPATVSTTPDTKK